MQSGSDRKTFGVHASVAVFRCDCTRCQQDAGRGGKEGEEGEEGGEEGEEERACFFQRSPVRLTGPILWESSSVVAMRGYQAGCLVAMRYAWGDYVRVRPTAAAVPVPFALFAYVRVAETFARLCYR